MGESGKMEPVTSESGDGVDEVLSFWLGAGPEAWYKQDDTLDGEITRRFGTLWEQGAAGALDEQWATNPRGALAPDHPARPVSAQHVPRRGARLS